MTHDRFNLIQESIDHAFRDELRFLLVGHWIPTIMIIIQNYCPSGGSLVVLVDGALVAEIVIQSRYSCTAPVDIVIFQRMCMFSFTPLPSLNFIAHHLHALSLLMMMLMILGHRSFKPKITI